MIRKTITTPLLAFFAVLTAGAVPGYAQKPEGKNDKPSAESKKPEGEKDAEDEEAEEKEEDRYFAVRGGIVHTISQGDLFDHTILCKNGKIVDIGTAIPLPEGTEVLDVTGHHVYPGLVAVSSGGVIGGDPPEDTTDVYSLTMEIALAGGITTAVNGNTATNLTFGDTDGMVVGRDLFQRLSYSTRDPMARRTLREDLDRCRQYLRDVEAWNEEKKHDPEAEEPDKDWIKGKYERFLQLLKGEATALISANTQDEILAVCGLVARYGIKAVISGAYEGWTVAPEMARAGLSAIVTPRRRVPGNDRLNRENGSSIENAAILHRHGVRLAIIPQNSGITLWGVAGRDLLQLNMEAAFAVRGGMANEDALRAITIDAARILGVDHRVGSIDVGKDANFAITDGDMLHYMTHTRWTVVNGRVAYDKQKDTLYSHIRPDGDLDAPAPDDYWPRRLGVMPATSD